MLIVLFFHLEYKHYKSEDQIYFATLKNALIRHGIAIYYPIILAASRDKQFFFFSTSKKSLVLLQIRCGSDCGISLLSVQVERSDSVRDIWFSEREEEEAFLGSGEPQRSCLGAYPHSTD